MLQSFSVDFPNLLVHRSVREVRQRLCGGIWKPGNDELILLHRSRYNSYKPTFFQNQSYAQRCWTSKEGPNAFEECESVREIIHFYFLCQNFFLCQKDDCHRSSPPTTPGCSLLTRDPNISRSLKRVYIKEGSRIILCPKPAAARRFGWCRIREPAVRVKEGGRR